jgi:hypothetical protein
MKPKGKGKNVTRGPKGLENARRGRMREIVGFRRIRWGLTRASLLCGKSTPSKNQIMGSYNLHRSIGREAPPFNDERPS